MLPSKTTLGCVLPIIAVLLFMFMTMSCIALIAWSIRRGMKFLELGEYLINLEQITYIRPHFNYREAEGRAIHFTQRRTGRHRPMSRHDESTRN